MAVSIEELRKRLKEQEESKGGNKGGSGDFASYPFWNIPENTTAVLRFLPDGADSNDFFWVERAVINIPFEGTKGKDNKKITVQVPCMHMFGEECPILNETKSWWKTDLEETARIYYKKRSYLYQGFVVNSPLQEESTPANPIRRFLINAELHNMIKAALMDPELDSLPTEVENGLDFRINKTKGAKFVTYETSSWSRKNRSLSKEERAAIEEHGLFDLKEFLPKKPDEAHLAAIVEMFEASVAGEEYDEARWGKFYKPYGAKTTTEKTEEVAKTTKAVAKDKIVEAETDSDDEEDFDDVSVGEVKKAVASTAKKVDEVETAKKPSKSPAELLEDLKRRRQNS